MRKLKLQMQMTINGFVAGPNGELDWMTWEWDTELKKYTSLLTNSFDTILMGRKMAEGFISYWSNVLKDEKNEEYDAAKIFIDTPKIVFTKTIENSKWINTKIAAGNLVEEISKIKNSPGRDIIVYGGASFVSSLVKNNLIDEYYIFINPSVIASGLSIFGDIESSQKFKLIESNKFECGIIVNNYRKMI